MKMRKRERESVGDLRVWTEAASYFKEEIKHSTMAYYKYGCR